MYWLLAAPPTGLQDAADMGRMVRDAKELFDEGGDARGGPDIADNAEGGSAFGEGSPQLRALVASQARRRAWGDAPVQTGHTACSAAFDPLADRARGDTQGRAAMSFCFQPCGWSSQARSRRPSPIDGFVCLLFRHAGSVPYPAAKVKLSVLQSIDSFERLYCGR